MNMRFTWVTPPENMVKAIEQYGQRTLIAVRAVADYMAQVIQDAMRTDASWEDRTGNARSGLFSQVDQAASDLITIYMSHGHTVNYGLWLEVANGGKYAIIMPTLEKHLPQLKQMLDDLFR